MSEVKIYEIMRDIFGNQLINIQQITPNQYTAVLNTHYLDMDTIARVDRELSYQHMYLAGITHGIDLKYLKPTTILDIHVGISKIKPTSTETEQVEEAKEEGEETGLGDYIFKIFGSMI